jgi:2,3-bisphosphoglycerate-dependent phosphoglycerate mutase
MGDEIIIHFMRHGRSRADDEGVHEGRYDSPLTDIGRSQVKARGVGWKNQGVRFDRIISSTLIRAHESAKIIGGLLDVPVEAQEAWIEMDNRPLAGLPFDVAESRYPRPVFRNPYEPFHGVGESEAALHCRAALALETLIRRGLGNYLVVSHGGFLNAILRNVVGAQPPVNGMHGIWFAFGDAGFLKCSYAPGMHRWVLRELIPG